MTSIALSKFAWTAVAALLVGCAGFSERPPVDHAAAPEPAAVENLAGDTRIAVEQLIGSLRVRLNATAPVLVATIADVSNLNASTPLGRMISEQIASNLTIAGYVVPDIRLTKTIMVGPQGEFVLSRELKALQAKSDKIAGAQAVVTGTYAAGRQTIWVSLHVVSLVDEDAQIIGADDYSIPITADIKGLLDAPKNPPPERLLLAGFSVVLPGKPNSKPELPTSCVDPSTLLTLANAINKTNVARLRGVNVVDFKNLLPTTPTPQGAITLACHASIVMSDGDSENTSSHFQVNTTLNALVWSVDN